MDVNKHFMNHINKWKQDRKQINVTVRQRLDLQCWISRYHLINIALTSWYEWLLLSSCSNSYCLWKGSHCQHLCLVTQVQIFLKTSDYILTSWQACITSNIRKIEISFKTVHHVLTERIETFLCHGVDARYETLCLLARN